MVPSLLLPPPLPPPLPLPRRRRQDLPNGLWPIFVAYAQDSASMRRIFLRIDSFTHVACHARNRGHNSGTPGSDIQRLTETESEFKFPELLISSIKSVG
jgi:hypothetical protein